MNANQLNDKIRPEQRINLVINNWDKMRTYLLELVKNSDLNFLFIAK